MNLLLQLLPIVGPLALLIVFYHLWVFFTKGTHIKKSKAVVVASPEPPGAWPIIGHLLQLSTPQPLFRTLAAMAEKHGPAFIVRFGVHPTLVISSWELAKECFTTNDKALASRPRSASGNYLTYNYAMFGFAPYGSYWREVRKLVVLELLSTRRLESLKHIKYAEIEHCMKDLHGLCVKNKGNQIKVEMNRLFCDLTMNIVLKMVVGKSYFRVVEVGECNQEVDRIQKTIIDFFRFTGASVASDAVPFLGWIGFKGEERAMKRIAKEMDVITERWLQEHREKRQYYAEKKDEQDFMDVMLSMLEEDPQFHGHPRDTVVKATSMGMILAATDTTAVSLSWALSLLLNNQQVLKKAQDEIDKLVNKDRNVDEKDICNLPYLHAVVKETFRLYPVAPLLIPHEAIEDCNVGGFRIRSRTRVLVNVWKIHRDPNIWSKPLEFQPERFLTNHVDVDVRGKNFELIPFGSGRRSCPGISFALQTMHMMLARLLHGFELQKPFDEPVDMTEEGGLTMPKKTPLEVLLSPRLPSHLYE
ncbi:cytochrome P450 CYP82D47-like [Macadamia integrifolia]|uniref:cytochrome P450 CYP82D47-like n=1 Tax=Macadamia integrifolia TaxID=60698 RepID=UPI001C52D6D4|nr:cytochrome P450 CYP82D47-like [Macadamia integrifolia]